MNIGKIHKIELNPVTSYLTGVIVGDGNISNSTKSKTDKSKDYRITIELIEKDYLIKISELVKSIIKTKSKVRSRFRESKNKEHHTFQFRNKSFYYFLVNDMEIPAGKKSNIVKVPAKIKNSLILQKYFLAGLFDTDGGVRSHTLGFTSASKELIEDTCKILNNLNFKFKRDSWINKKYNKYYYGIRIYLKDTDRFLKKLPMQNINKLKKCLLHVDI